MPVLIHAIQWLFQHEHYRPEYVLLLEPTSPFRRAAVIDAAAALLRKVDADSVVAVTLPSVPLLP